MSIISLFNLKHGNVDTDLKQDLKPTQPFTGMPYVYSKLSVAIERYSSAFVYHGPTTNHIKF